MDELIRQGGVPIPGGDLHAYVRAALGQQDGFLLPWSIAGCQYAHPYDAHQLLTCSVWESIHQCEVIGPHNVHRWSDHTISHERFGNGYGCWQIGNGRDADGRLLIPGGARLTVVGVR